MQKDGGRKPAEKVSTKTNAKGKHRRQESSISNAKVIPSQPPKPLTNPPPGFSFVTGNKDPGPASQGAVLKASEAQTRNVPHKNGQPIRTTNRSNEMAMDSSFIPPNYQVQSTNDSRPNKGREPHESLQENVQSCVDDMAIEHSEAL